MTAHELQRIATRLANQSWCRYWLNCGDRHESVTMAIQCRDFSGPVEIRELENLGFRKLHSNIYIIPRTNEDGTPFVPNLF